MAKKTTDTRFHIFLILLTTLFLFSATPFFLGSGLADPEPIGKYLNGIFPELPASQPPYALAFENLKFDNPITFNIVPGQNKIVLGQLDGKIFWFANDEDSTVKNLLLDLSNEVGIVSDGGFLGLTIHPDFGMNGNNFFYVYYATKDRNGNNFPDSYTSQSCDSEEYWGNFLILERFEVNPHNMTFEEGSRVNLLKIRMYGTTHRGGGLDFGNDGFLYLTMGDQTAWKKAQDIVNNLDGGVLRIDVDKDATKSHLPIRTMPHDLGYSDEITGNEYWIPNDNPFLSPDGSNFEEYYSLGLRNPHRMTKDMVTGTFYIGDVGLKTHEEINVLAKGKNYGWPLFEGNVPGPNCVSGLYNDMPHEPALVVFKEREANSIIGGYVYRGKKVPELYGKYICADYGYGDEIWSVDTQTGEYTLLGAFLPRDPISFGQDTDGEIYILKLGNDVNIYQIAPSIISYKGIPKKLSETGVFEDLTTLSTSEGLIPYDLIESFWSDGASKKRWMAIPNDGTHNEPHEIVSFSENGLWDFPVGTVLIKHFDLRTDENDPSKTKKVETRFSVVGEDGNFYFLTYNWNDDQTDATLQEFGIDESISIKTEDGGTRYQNWHYPSNIECITCHSNASKDGLGLKARYLNKNYTYDKTHITANQLVTLSHLGILDETITDSDTPNFLTHKAMDDVNATIDEKARSYLDLNCAYCHNPETSNRASFDLQLFNSLEETGLLIVGTLTPLGIEGEKVLVPGDASKSILFHRTNSLDATTMMPPLAKGVIDEPAVLLIEEWINQLQSGANQQPIAVASSTIISGSSPLVVRFTGSYSTDDSSITSYAWNFGDGTSSTIPNPVHTFSTAGTFIVEFMVTDDEGLTNTDTMAITVTAANQPPIAVIGTPSTSNTNQRVVGFSGSNSTDDSEIVNYYWNFGDGTSSTDPDPVHTFATAGPFTVEFTVTDGEGLTSTDAILITVKPTNQPPKAIIETPLISETHPWEVGFTGSNSTDDSEIVSYYWDFGDGTNSINPDPVHTYETGGNYIVELIVTDSNGLTHSEEVSITIDEISGEMSAILLQNPAQLGFAKIQILNRPADSKVMSIYLHDSNGRLVTVLAPQELLTGNNFEFSVSTLRDGIYFISLNMNQGDSKILKLLVRN